MKRLRMRDWRAMVVAFMAVAWPVSALAQTDAATARWRFYTATDGLRESWVWAVTCSGPERCWIPHGAVEEMTRFDGYRFERLPGPGANLVVREGPGGDVWALLPTDRTRTRYAGVQRFDGRSWQRYSIAELPAGQMSPAMFVAWAEGRVLLVQDTRLLEFDRPTGRTRTIVQVASTGLGRATVVEPAGEGGAWVGGVGVVARVRPEDGEAPSLVEHPLPAAHARATVLRLHDCGNDGLFVTAGEASASGTPSDRTVLLRLQAGAWQEVGRSESAGEILEGWTTAEGIWTATSNNHTFRLRLLQESGSPIEVPRTGVLSGSLHHVERTESGRFFVATSLGLALHTPATWRTPPALAHLTGHFGSLTQARDGTIYGLYESGLLRYRDGWELLPYPAGAVPNVGITDAIGELPDGRIALCVTRGASAFLFDPKTSTFAPLVHPRGRSMELLGTTSRRVWFRTFTDDRSWLETYDGTRFEERYDPGQRWQAIMPRAIIETEDGDVFVLPDRIGVGWLRGGTYKILGRDEGYTAIGAFTAARIDAGRMWFGGRDGILEYANGRWRSVRSDLQTVRSIVRARDGTVWVGSGSGVHAFRQGSWLTSTVQEGVPPGAVYDVLQSRDGSIWAATTLGLSRYQPELDAEPPRTLINAAQNVREAPPSGETRISFGGRDRWDQTPGTRLQYTWRVDAGSWSTFNPSPFALLQGLRVGPHRFEVRARDRNWNVDPRAASFSFVVLVPWYREPGFLAVLGAGLIALVAAISLFLTRHFRLERLVHERTEALAQANQQLRQELDDRQQIEEERAKLETQLHQSQKLEALGRLSGGLAHDFNNLLTVIGSYGELLHEELPKDDPLQVAIHEISSASDRAAALTRQLLTFSRHQVVSPQVTDLNTVVGGIERMLSRLIGEDVELVFRPGPDLWHVRVDPGQIEQVILNLAVNARDAMPRGGRLTIETQNVELDEAFSRVHVAAAPGKYVLLAVSDTGVGMDADTRARAFEPFFTTKERSKGTGLGLATVYGIVRKAEGHIWLYSEPDRGTSFKIYLPITEFPVDEAVAFEQLETAGGSETILLVEDEPAVRQLVTKVLQTRGYRVWSAEHAQAALDVWERSREDIHLVISDIVLTGGISGPELIARLEAERPGLRVLLMSGYADDAVLRNGTVPSDRMYLQKPFTPETLAARVREVLDA